MSLPNVELGKTGLQVPPLFFGATSLGNLFREVEDEEKAAIVDAWASSRLAPFVVDSAGKYGAGLSLEVIGRELDRLRIPADQAIISNKLGWRRVPLDGPEPTFEPGAWFGLEHDAVQDISYEGILRCWREGNELLGREAQVVSVHDPDEYLDAAQNDPERKQRLDDLVDAYRALSELKEQGRVAAVGVGAKNWRAIEALDQYCSFDWVMLANSFTIMRHPEELDEFMRHLAENNVAIINSALFQGGFLLGGEFFDYRKIDSTNAEDLKRLNWRDRFQQLCKEFEVSAFDVGVAFGKAHPAVTAVALSSSRADRVESHINALQAKVPVELWSRMRQAGLIADHIDFLA
ncbi:MAG: aldo/keto reductase [Planctomycetota bacterium]